MGAYLNQLNAAVANQEQARRDENDRAEAQAARERLTPLEERLARLLTTVPIELQREGAVLAQPSGLIAGALAGAAPSG
jgi:hypothetical protein